MVCHYAGDQKNIQIRGKVHSVLMPPLLRFWLRCSHKPSKRSFEQKEDQLVRLFVPTTPGDKERAPTVHTVNHPGGRLKKGKPLGVFCSHGAYYLHDPLLYVVQGWPGLLHSVVSR